MKTVGQCNAIIGINAIQICLNNPSEGIRDHSCKVSPITEMLAPDGQRKLGKSCCRLPSAVM